MTIIFYDGSTLTCNKVEFGIDGIIADDYRLIPYLEILRIIAE